MVTMHNDSTQDLLAVELTGEVTSPEGWNQSTGLSYDHFFKEAGIPPGEDFDVVGPDFFDSVNQGPTYINGVLVKPQEPKKDLVCHAEFKVQFIQFEDGSTWGDYQTKKDVMARRAKNMAILSHLVDAYDTGGEAGFAAALDEPESRSMAYRLKYEAAYFKVTVIDLVRKKLGAAFSRVPTSPHTRPMNILHANATEGLRSQPSVHGCCLKYRLCAHNLVLSANAC